jgi:quinol monooxygenase YgiN
MTSEADVKIFCLAKRMTWKTVKREGSDLFNYLIKILVKQYKTDEFMKNMQSLSPTIRKEKGCMGYNVYKHSENENAYTVVGEWKTRQAMEKHFLTDDFKVLIGAAKVLGEAFEMNIAEVSKTGSFDLAKEHIEIQKKKRTKPD